MDDFVETWETFRNVWKTEKFHILFTSFLLRGNKTTLKHGAWHTAALLAQDSAGQRVSRSAGQLAITMRTGLPWVSPGDTQMVAAVSRSLGSGWPPSRVWQWCRLSAESRPPPGYSGLLLEQKQAAEWAGPGAQVFSSLCVCHLFQCLFGQITTSLGPSKSTWEAYAGKGYRERHSRGTDRPQLLSKHKNQPSLNIMSHYSTLGAEKGHCGKIGEIRIKSGDVPEFLLLTNVPGLYNPHIRGS